MAHTLGAMGGGIGFWREAGGGLEDSMKMIGAQTRVVRQILEARHGLGVLNETADVDDFRRVLFGERQLIRFTAFARAKTRPLRVFGGEVKADVFRPRWARRAGRPTVHAGGFDGVEKSAVRR